MYLDRGGGVLWCVYFCGSLLSTQKRGIKKVDIMTKKSIEINNVRILIGDRLGLWSKSVHKSLA